MKRIVESEAGRHVLNLSKGGVLKVFDRRGPIADTGLIGELDDEGLLSLT